MQIPQVATSQQCLSCRGCCRFHDARWAPALLPDEAILLGQERAALCPGPDTQACSFLDGNDHHCRVYGRHPFECRLYPFLLSRAERGYRVHAHLACPAVEEARRSGQWEGHKAAIRDFFGRRDVQTLVQENASGLTDHGVFADEVEEVFAFDPAQALWDLQAKVTRALAQCPSGGAARSFIDLFAWQGAFAFTIEEIGGALCVFAHQSAGTFLYWPPLAPAISSSAVDACFARMRELNHGGSLTRIENVAEEERGAFDPAKYRIEVARREYVYDRGAVAALRGNDYKSRRGEVNVFKRACDGRYCFRPYVPEDFNACAILFDRWLDGRAQKNDNELYRYMLADNRGVHRLLLSHAAALGLTGRVVEIDGRVAAYTFGYPLTADTFCALLEITDLAVKGLAAFVFSRFCADEALRPFCWVNAMDDMAAEALGRTKKLWRPVRLENIYTVTEKERG